jgi:hypothetical protein
MSTSCIDIGRGFLPQAETATDDQLIDQAAKAVERHPEVAAEISLAAVDSTLTRLGAGHPSLAQKLKSLLDSLCKARDVSLAT